MISARAVAVPADAVLCAFAVLAQHKLLRRTCSIGFFFCRSHFVKITSAPEAAAVRSRRDGVIWLWKVHNEVNERLKKVRWLAVSAL
jgi:hypothetical protein